MKIAIVGSSKLTEEERERARLEIEQWIKDPTVEEVITGDASGIDELVRSFASENKSITVVKAIDKEWEGKYGFKQRNIKIAQMADHVVSISTKIKIQRCYHCREKFANHERTGGCWTKKFAIDKLGKTGETIVI